VLGARLQAHVQATSTTPKRTRKGKRQAQHQG
jgi:hypothetical protein